MPQGFVLNLEDRHPLPRGSIVSALRSGVDRSQPQGEAAHDSVLENAETANAFLEHLIASSPVVIVQGRALDEFEITYVSPNSTWVLGLPPTALVGGFERFGHRLHAEDWAYYVGHMAHAIEGQVLQLELEYRLIDDADRERWVSSVLYFDHGEPDDAVKVLGYLIDITHLRTAERQAVERQQTLETLVAASADAITLLDAERRITFVSPALARILGHDDADDLSSTIDDYLEQDQLGMLDQFERLFRREVDQVVLSHRATHRSGREVMLESIARLMIGTGDEVAGAVVVSRDVTERHHLEQALQQATSLAQNANRAKSEFLSRMSHELRTPLNAMLGFAQILEMSELPKDDEESVGHILKAGRHLLDLINEILDISRIEAGRLSLSLEPVEVSGLLTEAVMLVGPLAHEHDVTVLGAMFDRDMGVHVRADRQRLLQVVLNLMTNAIKYNRRFGTVRARCCSEHEDTLRISIIDEGLGIPDDQAGRIFEPFDRLGREGSSIEGTGIGLTLSRRLAEAMGGSLGFESVEGQGSTFWIELPAAASPDGDVGDVGTSTTILPSGWSPTTSLHRVLCIEDNVVSLEVVRSALAKGGSVEVIAAAHGHLGLDLARTRHPDLILLDQHLPDMPGDEVLRRLRNDPQTADIPVVIVSADPAPRIERLLSQGAHAVLPKPIDVHRLLELVDVISKKEIAQCPSP